MFGIILLAALGAQSASLTAQEKDLRCTAVLAAVLGRAAEDKSASITPLVTYYVGRVTGRDPNLDLEAELRRIYSDKSGLRTEFQTELTRCSAEAEKLGTDLMRIGNALKQGDPANPK